jgi:imidazolonepropionase-like amidohydrolase
MSNMEAILAGTRVNAEMLGWDDRLGTIEAGKLADIIAIPGNPLEDIRLLEQTSFVMLGGKIIKSPDQAAALPGMLQ